MELFFGRHLASTSAVNEARGVVLLALSQADITVADYAPTQVKLAVTGSGTAKKFQVGKMVQKVLNLPSPPRPDDSADAAAIAICHAHTQSIRFMIK